MQLRNIVLRIYVVFFKTEYSKLMKYPVDVYKFNILKLCIERVVINPNYYWCVYCIAHNIFFVITV